LALATVRLLGGAADPKRAPPPKRQPNSETILDLDPNWRGCRAILVQCWNADATSLCSRSSILRTFERPRGKAARGRASTRLEESLQFHFLTPPPHWLHLVFAILEENPSRYPDAARPCNLQGWNDWVDRGSLS